MTKSETLKKCAECSHFLIWYEAMMPWDTGKAVCDKHNLVVDFVSRQQINKLECIDGNRVDIHGTQVQPQLDWCPCSERKPQRSGRYEVTLMSKLCRRFRPYHVELLNYCKDEDRWENEPLNYEVIAWKDMPDPYKM